MNNRKPFATSVRAAIILGVSMSALGLPGVVGAQEVAPEAEDAEANQDYGAIVVSARRSEETLRDVPESITVFTAQTLGLFAIARERAVAN